ncbi:uncharacterized protein RSE6_01073 [Rhynchosporium secalis]|uniref:Uncharacterized protein n=1 Tax=Rhynchosporium secalis TaxID=38038 RepID=A0A1E1LWU8_RHYSE|nr:uncharacterized protein RSE6_01073 [Rhynchosporium secalis]
MPSVHKLIAGNDTVLSIVRSIVQPSGIWIMTDCVSQETFVNETGG